jgi:hypothetical protein
MQTRVFICYAHESPVHKDQVLALATYLRSHDVQVTVDQWALDRRRDWHFWAIEQITLADFVLVIASPATKRVGDGTGDPRKNRGLHAELIVLREWGYRDPEAALQRILPVILPGGTVDDIPLFLQPYAADHYVVTEISDTGTKDLMHALAGPD